MWRVNGLERFIKTSFRHAIFDRAYYRALEKEFRNEFGRPLRFEGLDIRLMNASDLVFPDNSFDSVVSRSVYEHISDVDQATREVARVLAPGGIAVIVVHLFPSLSGGHNLDWARPETSPSRMVPPWDHLRQNLFPGNAYLNKLREKQYLSIFGDHLRILQVQPVYEGERFLTEQILQELPDFSREELLKKSITVVLRKETNTGAG